MRRPGRTYPRGPAAGPWAAAAELLERLRRVDLGGDPRSLSGVPLPLEQAWHAQGLGPIRARFGDTRWLVACRLLLAHALTGWNWLPDLKALEQTVTGRSWNSIQYRAVRLLQESGFLERHYLYLSRGTQCPDHRRTGLVWLTDAGLQMLAACGVAAAQVVPSD